MTASARRQVCDGDIGGKVVNQEGFAKRELRGQMLE